MLDFVSIFWACWFCWICFLRLLISSKRFLISLTSLLSTSSSLLLKSLRSCFETLLSPLLLDEGSPSYWGLLSSCWARMSLIYVTSWSRLSVSDWRLLIFLFIMSSFSLKSLFRSSNYLSIFPFEEGWDGPPWFLSLPSSKSLMSLSCLLICYSAFSNLTSSSFIFSADRCSSLLIFVATSSTP